jgi:hypothetical protein
MVNQSLINFRNEVNATKISVVEKYAACRLISKERNLNPTLRIFRRGNMSKN